MKKITFNQYGYQMDGVPFPLISGEFHYFRVPAENWRERMNLLREAGATCIATYAPWAVHEPAEGEFHFDDGYGRELTAFLTLCKVMDFPVLLRPGPLQYSELIYGGLPEWLIKNYPEILARDIKGKMIGDGIVSYLHPVFLEKARKYYREINRIIKPFLSENNGPVYMVQPDNELAGLHIWCGSLDYHPVSMGFGSQSGRYETWLKEKYETINALNKAYGRQYSDFSGVYPADEASQADTENYYGGGKPQTVFAARRVKDYYEFYCSTLAEYMSILTGWFYEDGIHVPVCHNAAGTGMIPHFLETVKKIQSPFVLGVDHYYTLGPAWSQNNPTPQYALNVLMSKDFLRELGMPPSVFELQGGNLADFPPMLREDFKSCYMTNTAFGMKGMNYYIFTGGPNFGETGTTGKVYDFNAMVSARGEIRPTYYAMKEHNEFIRNNTWMQNVTRFSDVLLGYSWEGIRCEYHDFPDQVFTGMQCWNYLKLGMLFTLMGSGYQPEMIELGRDLPVDRLLIVPCSDTMPESKQKNLIRFVEEGGRLILTPVVPVMDENYFPCTLLKDFLGIGTIRKLEKGDGKLRLQNGEIIHQVYDQYICDGENGEPVAYNHSSGQITAWEKSLGKGRVIWLGANWDFLIFEHHRLMSVLCQRMGVEKSVLSDNPNLWTAWWEGPGQSCLFILNLFSGKQSGSFKIKRDGILYDLGEHEIPAMEVLPLFFDKNTGK